MPPTTPFQKENLSLDLKFMRVDTDTNKSCLHRMTCAPEKRFDRCYEHFLKPKRRP
ncbi:hypothetical protein DPMN_163718 [Dreissena polymorpha]|uniref:Uncharacterized protein n=1 Tax=Dreissena polymorpha TaxID=45954 RepID=A0A9D4EX70_DREPO|nr:hypothetical protein DPMN_163718 [Dreissena polymorpha]